MEKAGGLNFTMEKNAGGVLCYTFARGDLFSLESLKPETLGQP